MPTNNSFSPGAGPQYVTARNPNGLPPFLKFLSGAAGRIPAFQILNGVQAAARGKFMTDTPIGRLLTKLGPDGGTEPGPTAGATGGGLTTPGTVFAGYNANGSGLQYDPATGQTSVIPRAEAVNTGGYSNWIGYNGGQPYGLLPNGTTYPILRAQPVDGGDGGPSGGGEGGYGGGGSYYGSGGYGFSPGGGGWITAFMNSLNKKY